MKQFTLEELKDALAPLPFFGEILFELHKKENKMTQIIILDEEQERYVDSFGDVVEGDYCKITKIATLYVDNGGKITAVQHSYQSTTKNNVKPRQILLSLVGNQILFS